MALRTGPSSASGLRILVVGDAFLSSSVFARAFDDLERTHSLSFVDIPAAEHVPSTESELRLREYAGTPEWLAGALDGHDVLVVHGAPVTAEILDAAPNLSLVCCARGGPVNIDVDAAGQRGIPVVTTPGKNAESVADLALAFMVMLARRIPRAMNAGLGGLGHSAFEGAEFFGNDLSGHALGLVGYGNVGARVSVRARAFGMTILAYDPFVSRPDGADLVSLEDLLDRADFVSLHARATPENTRMFDATRFATMKSSSFFINTARPSLVDELALIDAIANGQIAGAALDVLNAGPHGVSLAGMDNVIVTPHIGGATHETLSRGAVMIAREIERFWSGAPLRYAVT